MSAHPQDRCPNCGKYVAPDGDCFFAHLDPDDTEFEPVYPFCDESCVERYYEKRKEED